MGIYSTYTIFCCCVNSMQEECKIGAGTPEVIQKAGNSIFM